MKIDLNKDIRYVKDIRGMNNTEIADFFNVSRMTLNRWQKGEIYPSYETLEKIYHKIYESGLNLNRLKEEMDNSSLAKNHVLLFHGAKKDLIGPPSIKYSEEKKDFGKGFYLGESFEQSASFVVSYKESSIYTFDFNKEGANIKEFVVSKEWMILIAYFRGRLDEYKSSKYVKKLLDELKDVDVVVAPIADNTMYTTLDDFIDGKITDLQCLHALSANRLGKQYVFLNDKVINEKLSFVEKCFFCELEKKDYLTKKIKENEIGRNKVKIALREFAGKGKYIEELLK